MIKKYIFIILIIQTSNLFAMGGKRPTTPTVPSEDNIIIPNPTINLGQEIESMAYLDIGFNVGELVDQTRNNSELNKQRELINVDQVDRCNDNGNSQNNFSEQISYYASLMLEDTKSFVGFVGSSYGTSTNDDKYFPTGLIRHPLCEVSSSTLATTLGSSSKVPSNATIDKINRFAKTMNEYRQQIINGNTDAKKNILHLWSSYYSCLAYTESLGSADTKTSYNVANKYAPTGFRKPAGVEFYEDPAQSAESRLNIGMYQFTPNSNNNIKPCLKAWNEIHKDRPQCLVNTNGSQNEMISIVGSSLQSFNAFCGIHKMVQTFSVQVNTKNTWATHPNNYVNGKLLPFEQRCVSPHFKAGRAYVHFGPFMNSTGSNLNELMNCVDKTAY